MDVNHLLLCEFQAPVDMALESSAFALSDAVSTSIWKPCSDEWLACKSELESAILITHALSSCPCRPCFEDRLRVDLARHFS